MKRKVYIGIGNPSERRQRALRTWIVEDDESLAEAQYEIAAYIASDYYNAVDEAEIAEEQASL